MQIVGTLLCDCSPGVVGAAAAAFASVCPNNLSLIARNYRGLCMILPDVEEWGQIILIGILLRYVIARYGLVEDSIMSSLCHTEKLQSEQHGPQHETKLALFEDNGDLSWNYQSELAHMVSKCYIEQPDEYLARSIFKNKASFEFKWECFTSDRSNEEVKILLQCTSPLLWSNNSAVVLAAASVHWIMAPKDDVKRIVKPLLFILRSSNESKYVVGHLLTFHASKFIDECFSECLAYPSYFVEYDVLFIWPPSFSFTCLLCCFKRFEFIENVNF